MFTIILFSFLLYKYPKFVTEKVIDISVFSDWIVLFLLANDHHLGRKFIFSDVIF